MFGVLAIVSVSHPSSHLISLSVAGLVVLVLLTSSSTSIFPQSDLHSFGRLTPKHNYLRTQSTWLLTLFCTTLFWYRAFTSPPCPYVQQSTNDKHSNVCYQAIQEKSVLEKCLVSWTRFGIFERVANQAAQLLRVVTAFRSVLTGH